MELGPLGEAAICCEAETSKPCRYPQCEASRYSSLRCCEAETLNACRHPWCRKDEMQSVAHDPDDGVTCYSSSEFRVRR